MSSFTDKRSPAGHGASCDKRRGGCMPRRLSHSEPRRNARSASFGASVTLAARVLLASGVLAAALAAAPPAPAQPPPPSMSDVRGGDGYPDQAPVAGWLKEIAARQGRVRSLAAAYEIQYFLRGRMKPALESGTVKLRFPEEPDRPPMERWEGKGESGRVLRVVRDGRIHAVVGDKAEARDVREAERATASLFRFPLLPASCAARHYVFHSRELEPGLTGPTPERPFPTALGFILRPGVDDAAKVRRFYLVLDEKTGLAQRIRWTENVGFSADVELFDTVVDAPVTDADFAPPAGAAAPATPSAK